MGTIRVDDISEKITISEEDVKQVKGGIGLLLPAVQKVREASSEPLNPKVRTGHFKNVDGL